jgi:hypothetical protein
MQKVKKRNCTCDGAKEKKIVAKFSLKRHMNVSTKKRAIHNEQMNPINVCTN